MRINLLMTLVCIWAMNACKSSRQTVLNNSQIDTPQQVFYLETTTCFGTCPSYKITIFDNDSLLYEGISYVAKEGKLSKKLPQGTVQGLIEKFRIANFFSFKNQYTARISDLPTTYISFTDQGKTKKIMDYYQAPQSLKRLEELLNNLVKKEVETIEK